MPQLSLKEIARLVEGTLSGPDRMVRSVKPLEEAGEEDLSFLALSRYLPKMESSRAGGVLVAPVGSQGQTQWITIAEKTDRGVIQRRTIAVQFVPFTRRAS